MKKILFMCKLRSFILYDIICQRCSVKVIIKVVILKSLVGFFRKYKSPISISHSFMTHINYCYSIFKSRLLIIKNNHF